MILGEFTTHYTSFDTSKKNSLLLSTSLVDPGNCDEKCRKLKNIIRCLQNITIGTKFIRLVVALGPTAMTADFVFLLKAALPSIYLLLKALFLKPLTSSLPTNEFIHTNAALLLDLRSSQ